MRGLPRVGAVGRVVAEHAADVECRPYEGVFVEREASRCDRARAGAARLSVGCRGMYDERAEERGRGPHVTGH